MRMTIVLDAGGGDREIWDAIAALANTARIVSVTTSGGDEEPKAAPSSAATEPAKKRGRPPKPRPEANGAAALPGQLPIVDEKAGAQ
jgi:hypothetical protein